MHVERPLVVATTFARLADVLGEHLGQAFEHRERLGLVSRAQLSGIAVVPCEVIEEFEAGGTVPSKDDLAAMRGALEWADVEFIDGEPGVRLRK
jgi:hypothetical protein